VIVKTDIRALSLEQISSRLTDLGEPRFRARQVHDWLWQKGVHDFAQMSNLPLSLRQKLDEHFAVNNGRIAREQHSVDGTIKNAVALHDGNVVESVLIPTDTRITACVSSQVGCSLDCSFCATARLSRVRNLNADEIFDQVVTIREQARLHFGRPLTHIVFMGMGEPLLNYPQVMGAIDRITAADGLAMAPWRITLSTAGIPKMIRKLADDRKRIRLAVSLHSAIPEKRTRLMSVNAACPLPELQSALQYWYRQTGSKVTFEYVVWAGVNDTDDDIRALLAFTARIPSKVNLIQYNAIDQGPYQQAGVDAVEAYRIRLLNAGVAVSIRRSRGSDIDAACGQLAGSLMGEDGGTTDLQTGSVTVEPGIAGKQATGISGGEVGATGKIQNTSDRPNIKTTIKTKAL